MLGILILARGAFLPADTTQGKLTVLIGGLLVIIPYVLTWLHFNDRLEKLEGENKELKNAKHQEHKIPDAR